MTLFDKVLEETRPFLGAQTEQFVRRQCERHLFIAPRRLTEKHLPSLSYWMMISASLVIPAEQATILEQRILALGQDAQG